MDFFALDSVIAIGETFTIGSDTVFGENQCFVSLIKSEQAFKQLRCCTAKVWTDCLLA